MSMKLRDLIRKVRQCKTAAEERAVIAKESAMIRTAIREEQSHFRHRNVAKLLFMHMLGYPTHFGQLECMKLTASPHFPEKRIGYLGMLLLLSEEADVLMLATNALKNDLVSETKFVAGLALMAIGNLATADMSRDLAPEVDKHLKSPLPYLRKKACLAMARCLAKCPELVEDFSERIASLLKDKSHGVLICVVQLMTQVVMIDYRNAVEEGDDPYATECRQCFVKLVPNLVKMLRNLLSAGYSPDHDVGGISDPFLQVQLLTLLRLLGANDENASEQMNDVLAQVATNTETSKNAGNAILYECVQTIMGVEAEDGLRVLAVNILGRFLLNRDNNIRYVALNTLARCIVEQRQMGREDMMVDIAGGTGGGSNNNADGMSQNESNAVSAMAALQRHRTTVVDCLKDPDISIRQRALELIYHLVNESNVETLTAELLNYLVLCPREHRSDMCTRVLKVVDRYAPDDRWRIDTLITTLTIAGREATRDVQSATVVYISRAVTSDLHAFATHKLAKAMRDDDGSQHGLLAVGVWCVGEYGDLLLQPYTYTYAPTGGVDLAMNGNGTAFTFDAMAPSAIVDAIEAVTKRHSCPNNIKQRALTAYVKLANRLSDRADAATLQRLQNMLSKHKKSRSLELQLRACEYDALLNAARGVAVSTAPPPPTDDIFGVSEPAPATGDGVVSDAIVSAAKEALARMPVVDVRILQKRLATDEFSVGSSDVSSRASSRNAAPAVNSKSGGGDLLDLNDIFGAAAGAGGAAPTANGGSIGATLAPVANGDAGKSDLDLLSDIFSAPAPSTTTNGSGYDPFSGSAIAAASNPMDLFGSGASATPSTMANGTSNTASNNISDLFGAGPSSGSAPMSNGPAAPSNDMFGNASTDPFASTSNTAPTPPANTVTVPGLSHGGLNITFECSKPDPINNRQKSTLLARFSNTTGAGPLTNVNMQVAVPKFITMEMEPPSSTTVPPSGGGVANVTQKVHVKNSMLGNKNLVLKVKIGFTNASGQLVEHMATCSGFPAGEY